MKPVLVSVLVVTVLLGAPWLVTGQTAPPYCSYADGSFYCQYAVMPGANRPIDFTQFSISPQILTVTANGFVPFIGDIQTFSSTFNNFDKSTMDANSPIVLEVDCGRGGSDTQTFSSTFNNFDKSTMDVNSPIVLEVDCGRGGSLYLQAGAFYNMSHVQRLVIKNCNTYNIPSYAFEGLENLDSIVIDTGIIDYVDPNSMVGLNVEKLTADTHQPPQLFGQVSLTDTRFTSGVVPPGFLYSWKNLTSVRMHNANITIITSDLFRYNTKIRQIDLSDNLFTTLPSGIWTGLNSLSEMSLYSIDCSCTCSELWFIENARENNITLFGGLSCSTGGMTAEKYYYTNCAEVDVCEGQTGFTSGSQCQTLLGVIITSVGGVTLILNIVALTLTIMNLRIIPDNAKTKARRENAKNKWKEAAKKAKSKKKNKVKDSVPEV